MGDLLKALEVSGKRDNTLIVYLGDHGADLLRGKRTSYEGGLRIPLIIAGSKVKVATYGGGGKYGVGDAGDGKGGGGEGGGGEGPGTRRA